jgi:hypothetical protein
MVLTFYVKYLLCIEMGLLKLCVDTFCKSPINQIANTSHVYGRSRIVTIRA